MESRMAEVTNPLGLHAQPAVGFAALAMTFESDIYVSRASGGPVVDGKKVIELLGLDIWRGEKIVISAEGSDAGHAVDALAAFLEKRS